MGPETIRFQGNNVSDYTLSAVVYRRSADEESTQYYAVEFICGQSCNIVYLGDDLTVLGSWYDEKYFTTVFRDDQNKLVECTMYSTLRLEASEEKKAFVIRLQECLKR